MNGKKYIGVHNNTDDDYLGSGKLIRQAVKRYGKDKFIRETLFTYDTAEEAYAKEAEIVTPEICTSQVYYNINLGGFQPPNHKGKHTPSPKKSEANRKRWADDEFRKRACEAMSRNHHKKKPCVIDGIPYPSQSAAARALGTSRQMIHYLLTKTHSSS